MRNFPAQYQLQSQDVLNFSHIPKTAGMTFRTIVEDQFRDEETCPATLNAQIKSIPAEAFANYRLFRGHLAYTNLPELLPPDRRMINVTVLREPIARVISHYEYIRRMPGDPFYEAVKDMTLEEFAHKLPAGSLKKNLQTYYLAKLLKFDLYSTPPDEIFELAKQSLDQCAFVGLVERFQDSLYLLSYIFGWNPIINTRRENAAKSKSPLDELPDRTLEVLKENSAYDIELYQYAKDIFEQRFDQMVQDLRQKYSDQPLTDESISSDALLPLLDKHYNQRYAERKIPTSEQTSYNFAEPLRGSGWQRRERSKDLGIFRWIGPSTTATLDLPLQIKPDTDLAVEFRIPHTRLVAPDILSSLAVSVNGQPITVDVLHTDQGSRFYYGLIPSATLKSDRVFTEFKFQVCRTASLQERFPDNPDSRILGLAFNYMQVFPAKQRYQSHLASMFDSPAWKLTTEFLQKTQVEDAIVAPLLFRAAVPRSIINYDTFLRGCSASWVVLHKGETDRMAKLLFKLLIQGYAPVYANEVFVVFTNRRDFPRLAYSSPHVKPLYANLFKRNLVNSAKSVYRKYFSSKPNPV
ncbi:MAG: sulfotransferase family 2 domain-containing protein [Oscillatoriophycideae cyanobacterium NC_groundwater_1537_Pr4_S-0.65um_50_18]|nr:sulfotransferase family 2 domain-containing protein [Oscillatoriophycideae cyanobacterium NC_groundwater_1537_Pr4_S-0.65um_50_18]